MSDNHFIDARKFIFTPFPHPLHPDDYGDSGQLEIATSKADSNQRYIVKRGYPELACNEFMYHKIANAVGLYTQDVKLIQGNREYRRAAAIHYVPNASKYDLGKSTAENLAMYCGFEALFVILNEEDSHEYYLDEEDRLFKLDNAAAFTVTEATIRWFSGDPVGHFLIPDINAPLNAVDYYKYNDTLELLIQNFGESASDMYLEVIHRFAELDTVKLQDAYIALDKQYSHMLKNYYDRFIQIRRQACKKFLSEINK